MSAIWRREADEWRPLLPAGFANEEALHDLVEEAPHLLPLSGDPNLVVVGREVALGTGYADLVAVEPEGRLSIIEIKLRRNAEARRAVLAQVLMYAAFLKGIDAQTLERDVLGAHIATRPFSSLAEAAREADQTGSFNEADFAQALQEGLTSGGFRLVLVLDEAPAELVQLVGYLESISAGIVLDLITVSAYQVGSEQILVPQRVDPEHTDTVPVVRRAGSASTTGSKAKPRPIDGADQFAEAVERAEGASRATLERLLGWARALEERQLAALKTVLGADRQILLLWLPGEKAGLASIWSDGGGSISLWRSVFARRAWELIDPIEQATGKPMGQGTTVAQPTQELLDLLTRAYENANENAPAWDGSTYYVSFGEGPNRDWDDARKYGFVAAGGGSWYSKALKQLKPGDRVFVYIPKGNGVGGYVGYGEVTREAMLARDFVVDDGGRKTPITEIAKADMARERTDDPESAEWVVPVNWLNARPRDQAVRDSDFFANQNCVVRLTHGYTIKRLSEAFEVGQTG